MKSTYEQQVREVVAASPPSSDVITEADIAALPDPVQRFLRTHGYVGRGPFANAEVVWSESQIRMGRDRDWLELDTRQFPPPALVGGSDGVRHRQWDFRG